MNIQQFADYCLTGQLQYIAKENALMLKALKTPCDENRLPIENRIKLEKMGLQPLTTDEMVARLVELNEMKLNAPKQYAVSQPSIKAAYDLQRGR